MSAPVTIFDVLEAGEVVLAVREIEVIVTWNRSAMVRMWTMFETEHGEQTWIEENVVTLGGEQTRAHAELVARRMVDEYVADFIEPTREAE